MSVSRRTVVGLGLAGVGAAALGFGGWGLTSLLNGQVLDNKGDLVSGGGAAGSEPKRLVSRGGKLNVDLVVSWQNVDINGTSVRVMTYGGTLPGPTWVVHPGDLITVNFTNNLGEMTNLHTHGFHVSPEGNSDNIFVHVEDGETFTYQYQLPPDHATGMFWYHPHPHGMSAPQVFAGLYGAILVVDKNSSEADIGRVFIVSDISFDSSGAITQPSMMEMMMGREGSTILVNGQVQPTFAAIAGSTERWHILNACSSRYLNIHLAEGAMTVLAVDAGHYATPQSMNALILSPANRADLLVPIGDSEMQLQFNSIPHPDNMASTNPVKNYRLFAVAPKNGAAVVAAPVLSQDLPDLRNEPIVTKREFTLAMPNMGMGMGGMQMQHGGNGMSGFTINGESFDPHVINTTTVMNTVEEWTIINATNMSHPFHLHVWPMQILSVGGTSNADVRYQDTIHVPGNGRAVIRVAFTDYGGMTVYHCHILDHEDAGMMGVIAAQ